MRIAAPGNNIRAFVSFKVAFHLVLLQATRSEFHYISQTLTSVSDDVPSVMDSWDMMYRGAATTAGIDLGGRTDILRRPDQHPLASDW